MPTFNRDYDPIANFVSYYQTAIASRDFARTLNQKHREEAFQIEANAIAQTFMFLLNAIIPLMLPFPCSVQAVDYPDSKTILERLVRLQLNNPGEQITSDHLETLLIFENSMHRGQPVTLVKLRESNA